MWTHMLTPTLGFLLLFQNTIATPRPPLQLSPTTDTNFSSSNPQNFQAICRSSSPHLSLSACRTAFSDFLASFSIRRVYGIGRHVDPIPSVQPWVYSVPRHFPDGECRVSIDVSDDNVVCEAYGRDMYGWADAVFEKCVVGQIGNGGYVRLPCRQGTEGFLDIWIGSSEMFGEKVDKVVPTS